MLKKEHIYPTVQLKEGINIRLARIRKFRNKNWSFFILVQITTIFYIFAFTLIYMLGSTNAYFNDRVGAIGAITAGTWETSPPEEVWDKSSLAFTGAVSNQDKNISAAIKNNGNDMAGSVPYEIWWAEKGNPKEGTKIGDGTVPALKSGEVFNLKFTTQKPGNYMFKAYQRPNHGDSNNNKDNKNNGNVEGALWSTQITVADSNHGLQVVPEKGTEQKVQNDTPVHQQPVESNSPPNDTEAQQSIETEAPKSEDTSQIQSEEVKAHTEQNVNEADVTQSESQIP
ncbi:amyloid fiber anchoring/assembly protein TapA [Bacillus sp. T33-2]|uniref:amyloid fiber anchoring/assembly protein TapA n=1 Tax=Bacillus sp. T33-2 TaxID=2054168 RepID=UPI000C7673BB|nr:amyloid fiber anchoring/assembly protein TapA [Bacillus sp. T33-2]PLR99284.1 amyloid fiber anchoring/assembly protein TapA [Bacillus sp. T33-2]